MQELKRQNNHISETEQKKMLIIAFGFSAGIFLEKLATKIYFEQNKIPFYNPKIFQFQSLKSIFNFQPSVSNDANTYEQNQPYFSQCEIVYQRRNVLTASNFFFSFLECSKIFEAAGVWRLFQVRVHCLVVYQQYTLTVHYTTRVETANQSNFLRGIDNKTVRRQGISSCLLRGRP